MVQEVQTWVWVYNETTLETIEAIGTSSFKIVEWRQTKWWHYASEVNVSWTSMWSYVKETGIRQSGMVESTNMSIWSSSWKQEYSLKNLGIRVPSAWTYQCTLYWTWGASSYQPTIYLIRWTTENDIVLYTKTFWRNGSETITINADLGKFDILTVRWKFYYSWSSDYASPNLSYSLTLQQI